VVPSVPLAFEKPLLLSLANGCTILVILFFALLCLLLQHTPRINPAIDEAVCS
jgi:hypothetical protein